jgi:hypothetical protein
MDIYRSKTDIHLMVCEHCVKDQEIDISDYDEYPLGVCSICGAVNEDARFIETGYWI